MSIAEFIQNKILRPRLEKIGCLVVDASKSSIESRVAAMLGLRDVIDRQLAGMLVYVPVKAPQRDEERQVEKSLTIARRLEDLYVEPEAAPKKTRKKKGEA